MGVKYFKLVSKYDGDYTKNCGLTGEEIDGNFHFLRGYDIKGLYINEETGDLVIERVNGEQLSAKVGEKLCDFVIDFDPITGVLTYTTYNGNTYKVEGFLTESSSIKMSTDHTIDGTGQIMDPLRLSNIATTGTYKPSETVIDCTNNEKLPKGESVGKGYRVVTKEFIDKIGKLYTLDGVREIMKSLELTEWRVPTKDDWDNMLNSKELFDEERNHHLTYSNASLGKNAGAF